MNALNPDLLTNPQAPSTFTDVSGWKKLGVRIFRSLNILVLLFLTWDATIKIFHNSQAVEVTVGLGYPASALFGIGLVELLCLTLYLIPRTSILGAILWTGYLGGAIATHVRVENPLFSHVLFPIYIAVFLWGGLWLRSEALRKLVPVARRSTYSSSPTSFG